MSLQFLCTGECVATNFASQFGDLRIGSEHELHHAGVTLKLGLSESKEL